MAGAVGTFLKELAGKPLFWFGILIAAVSLYIVKSNGEEWKTKVVHSDGRGYYYFLPATLIYHDNTYVTTLAAERKMYGFDQAQPYILKTENGSYINKCYPGVAILQAPFFLTAMAIDGVSGTPLTGYSGTFMALVIIGSGIYALLGIYFLYRLLYEYSGKKRFSWGISGLVFFGTNASYLALAYPGYSHNYSFFLMSLFLWLIYRYIRFAKLQWIALAALVLGLIFLVRPTNVLIVLFIPFLCGSWAVLKQTLTHLFTIRNKHLLAATLLFTLTASILLLTIRLQTGSWFYWSYQGEGFYFAHPQIAATLWSYRVGIFIQTPLTILGIYGFWLMFRENVLSSLFWLFYFLVIVYVLSSWWCWDYQSFYGHRAFTEHLLIFAFPLMAIAKRGKDLRIFYAAVILVLCYTGIRLYQCQERIFSHQKFTASSFWMSLLDFKESEIDRYAPTYNCPPFGKINREDEVVPNEREFTFTKDREFGCEAHYVLPAHPKGTKYFFELTLDKKFPSGADQSDVKIVFAGQHPGNERLAYLVSPMYNAYKEGGGDWKSFRYENEMDPQQDSIREVKFYIWNQGFKEFEVKNVMLKVTEYYPVR